MNDFFIGLFTDKNFLILLAFMIISLLIVMIPKGIKFRIPSLILGMIFLGFYLGICTCAVGALVTIPLLFMNGFNIQGLYFIIMAIVPIIFLFIAGRIFCGNACPMGAYQEFLFEAGKFLKLNKGNPGLEKISWGKYIKYGLLAGLILFALITGINIYCQFEPFYVLFNFNGENAAVGLLIGISILSVFFSRVWCRFICPYGAFQGLIISAGNKIMNKRYRPSIDKESCKHCGLCERKCMMNAIKDCEIDYTECINCGNCRKICKFKCIKEKE